LIALPFVGKTSQALGGKTRTFWWALASCVLMGVGALGPWITVLGISISGTEGDGWIVLLAALLAAGLVIWHDRNPQLWKLLLAGLAAVAAFATGAYDWSEIETIAGEAEELEGLFDLSVSVGWGLMLCTVASISLGAALVTHYLLYRSASFTTVSEHAPAPPPIEPDA
jgi:hypothetical protein